MLLIGLLPSASSAPRLPAHRTPSASNRNTASPTDPVWGLTIVYSRVLVPAGVGTTGDYVKNRSRGGPTGSAEAHAMRVTTELHGGSKTSRCYRPERAFDAHRSRHRRRRRDPVDARSRPSRGRLQCRPVR